jgi:catechol 2,3-dioxygenase-like lactoylglutathione lyase family enzyme
MTFVPDRLDHVSLNVSDRGASIAWYSDVLGLEQRNQPRADDWPVFMGPFGVCIALFQAGVVSPERAEESTGLRHVAFAVGEADFERAQARLRERGVAFRSEDHGNAQSIYFADPDGNVIELTSYGSQPSR